MTISNIKDLEAVIKLCRKTGVEHIIIDGVELNLGPAPIVYKKESTKAKIKDTVERVLNPGVAYTPTEDTSIHSDMELTGEQLLFYSAQGNEQ